MINTESKIIVAVLAIISFIACTVTMLINIPCGIICVILCVALNTIFITYTRRRYKDISELNNYLSRVCSGDYSLELEEHTEGELSIIKSNIYKVVVMLKSTNERLIKDKHYLADSLADISHQLKTPLTAMMVMTDLIKNENDCDKRNEFVDIINNQLNRIQWLISTLLKISKLDAGTVDFNFVDVSAKDLIENSIKPFEVTIDVKNINLEANIEAFDLSCDMNWCCEAIQNIIKNCLEHTDNGGMLRIDAYSTNVFNQIIIEDNGCGISESNLPHIFERFYRCNSSNNDSVGIGLALAKEILTKHNATIDVNSEINKGTRFDIKFYKSIV